QQFFDGLAEIMYKITGLIMVLVPIGIFGLLAPIIGAHGLSVLLPLLKLIFAMFVACLIHDGLVYSSAVKTFGQMIPLRFFIGIFSAVAFSIITRCRS